MHTADTAEVVVVGEVPAPGGDGVPAFDVDFHLGLFVGGLDGSWWCLLCETSGVRVKGREACTGRVTCTIFAHAILSETTLERS